jgi:hypothetical protein
MFRQPDGGATVGSLGDEQMYKALIGAGALLLATAAVPASAHDGYDDGYYGNGYSNNGYNNNYNNGYNNNYNNGYDNNGYGYRGYGGYDYDTIRWHVRACRQHERFHQTLSNVHDQQHEQGLDDYGDHRDVHQALNEAHDEYHENHPGAQNCSYWYSQYYNYNRGYYNRGYGRPYYRSYGYSNGY